MKLAGLFFLFFAICSAFAQDKIYKRDNTVVEAKILEASPTEIRYKLFAYQDGPLIIISKSDVSSVIYQNGVREVYKPSSIPPAAAPQRLDLDLRDTAEFNRLVSTRQVLFLNVQAIYAGCLGVSYFREFAQNRLNIYLPVSVGLKEDFFMQQIHYSNDNNPTNIKYVRTIDAGLGLNYQFTRTQHIFFAGVLVGMNQFRGTYDFYTSTPSSIPYGFNNLYLLPHAYVVNNYYALLNAGGLYRITKHFNIMLNLACGYQKTGYVSGDPKNAGPTTAEHMMVTLFKPFTVRTGFSLGYRF